MDAGSVVRAARRRSGLTQAALAARARTAQSTIAAYETGAKDPTVATLDRIVRAAGSTLQWSLGPSGSVLTTTVAGIGDALRRRDEPEALRHVATLHEALGHHSGPAADLTDDPGSTGDRRWDALVAGVVERAAHRAGVRTPAWTASPERFLDTWWFVSPYPALHASALVDAPAELANRGVFLHAGSLESV